MPQTELPEASAPLREESRHGASRVSGVNRSHSRLCQFMDIPYRDFTLSRTPALNKLLTVFRVRYSLLLESPLSPWH